MFHFLRGMRLPPPKEILEKSLETWNFSAAFWEVKLLFFFFFWPFLCHISASVFQRTVMTSFPFPPVFAQCKQFLAVVTQTNIAENSFLREESPCAFLNHFWEEAIHPCTWEREAVAVNWSDIIYITFIDPLLDDSQDKRKWHQRGSMLI